MYTDRPNHEPSLFMMNSGDKLPGRPSMGSWLTYGLGTENQNLPGYIVLCPGLPVVGPQLWGSSFLPGVYQGTYIPNNETDPDKLIQFIRNKQLSPRRAAPPARSAGQAEPPAGGPRRRRSAAGSQHPVDGDRLPHADRSAGRLRHRQGIRSHTRPLRRRRFRTRLPDGAAPGGARRAHGAGLLRQRPALGQSRRHHDPPQAGRYGRQADRRAAEGPEIARPAAGHDRHDRRRVRPHARGRNQRPGESAERPRPQQPRLLHAAGRRRRQRAA